MHLGVYRIHCVEIQKSYYGSSNNIYRRFNEHRSLIRRKNMQIVDFKNILTNSELKK